MPHANSEVAQYSRPQKTAATDSARIRTSADAACGNQHEQADRAPARATRLVRLFQVDGVEPTRGRRSSRPKPLSRARTPAATTIMVMSVLCRSCGKVTSGYTSANNRAEVASVLVPTSGGGSFAVGYDTNSIGVPSGSRMKTSAHRQSHRFFGQAVGRRPRIAARVVSMSLTLKEILV